MLLETMLKEPILVQNPHSGQLLNIAPLFDLLEQFGGGTRSPKDVQESIKEIARLLNLANHDVTLKGVKSVADANYDLCLLEDMFAQIIEKP